jgi:phenylpyruvate C(3)-methyltransferase
MTPITDFIRQVKKNERLIKLAEVARTTRVVGPRRMLKLFQAYRWGWQGILAGYFTTRSLQALFNVGFFDEMQTRGRVRVAAYAAEHDLDEGILQALCESLYALRILRKEEDAYLLDRKGKVLVETARGWFDLVYGYEELFHNLEALLTRDKVYGRDFYRESGAVARGSGSMEQWIYFPLAADFIEREGFTRVLDLGCGDGTFLRHIARANPAVAGYGVDIAPAAIQEGLKANEEAGLQQRIHLFVHDINAIEEAPPELRDVQVATIFFILHELRYDGRETVIEFLRSYRRLFPGVPLLVFEVIRPSPEEQRRRPGLAVQYLLYHELAQQKLVTRDEWIEMFQEAGFHSIEEQSLDFARTTIFILNEGS